MSGTAPQDPVDPDDPTTHEPGPDTPEPVETEAPDETTPAEQE